MRTASVEPLPVTEVLFSPVAKMARPLTNVKAAPMRVTQRTIPATFMALLRLPNLTLWASLTCW